MNARDPNNKIDANVKFDITNEILYFKVNFKIINIISIAV